MVIEIIVDIIASNPLLAMKIGIFFSVGELENQMTHNGRILLDFYMIKKPCH